MRVKEYTVPLYRRIAEGVIKNTTPDRCDLYLDVDLKTNFKSEPYSKFLSTLKSRSIYNFGIDVSENDKILTLSTCDNTGTKRVAVHAKMINIEYK